MNEQDLKQWLNAADVSAAEPSMWQLDATKLQRLVAHRRLRRRCLATVTTAAMLLAVAMLTARSVRVELTTPKTNKMPVPVRDSMASKKITIESLREQLHGLRAKIQEREALVAALRQAQKLERLNGELSDLEMAAPSPLAALVSLRKEQVRNEAAAISLFYADRLDTEFGEHELSAAEYRIIVSRFPGTTWSAAAEQSLLSTEGNL